MKRTFYWDKEQGKLVEIEKRVPDAKIYIIPDIEPYVDENVGQRPVWVKSRQHRTQLLKERGLAIK